MVLTCWFLKNKHTTFLIPLKHACLHTFWIYKEKWMNTLCVVYLIITKANWYTRFMNTSIAMNDDCLNQLNNRFVFVFVPSIFQCNECRTKVLLILICYCYPIMMCNFNEKHIFSGFVWVIVIDVVCLV